MNQRRRYNVLLLIICIFIISPLSASSAATGIQTERWSFTFSSWPVEDVLEHVSTETNVKISTNIDIRDRIVDRTYRNSTLDNIISDIFRDRNHAIIWQYKSKKLVAIEIWSKDKPKPGKNPELVNFVPANSKPGAETKNAVRKEKISTEGNTLKEIPLKWQHLDPPPVPPIRFDR
jgi:hypothetical protein